MLKGVQMRVQTFQIFDKVTWNSQREYTHFLRQQFGPGPFVVFSVQVPTIVVGESKSDYCEQWLTLHNGYGERLYNTQGMAQIFSNEWFSPA